MNKYADKPQENKNEAVANSLTKQLDNGKPSAQFADNQPEAFKMRKLQEMANNSPRARQLRSIQEMAINSPQARKAAQLQAMSNNGGSPVQRVIRIGKKKLKSRKNISQLWRADDIDEHLGLGSEEKKKFQSELVSLAEGKNITEFPGWDEAYQRLKEPKILITGDDGVVSIVKDPTDLMIWLGSYPPSSKDAPRGYANTAILQYALSLLEGVRRTVTNQKVWRAIAVAKKAISSGGGAGEEWGELDLVDSVDLLGKRVEKAVPGRYRRKLPAGEYQKKMQELSSSLGGYKLVGLHATTMENTGSLVKEGVSGALFNTGHGVGKGNGFYIIPALRVTSSILKNAKGWGSHVVAVFLPDDAKERWAKEGENVQTLEEKNARKKPRYYTFGKAEAVIPPSLCPKVKIVVDPADISMGDTKYEAESYDDEFGFLESL